MTIARCGNDTCVGPNNDGICDGLDNDGDCSRNGSTDTIYAVVLTTMARPRQLVAMIGGSSSNNGGNNDSQHHCHQSQCRGH